MRKAVILFLIMLMLMTVGLGTTLAQDEEGSTWTCPEGFEGQTLRIFNWSTYIAEDTIPDFKELCGVEVEYSEFESNEAMLTVIREGSALYDVIVPSGSTVSLMIAEGLLHPINFDNVPNAANISPSFLNPTYDPTGEYTVPYQWGTIGIGYNVNYVDEITSWDDVFNYDGPVAWLDDPRSLIGTFLVLLGYDPNTENPDEIAEARDLMIEKGGNVVAVAADDGQTMLERGDVDITIEYNGDIVQLLFDCECEDYAFVIPDEGANIWVDNLAIPASAPNPELAEVFLDYILDPYVGADLSNYIAYGTPNQASLDMELIDEEMLTNPAVYMTEDVMETLFVIIGLPDSESVYLDAWAEVLVGLGQ